MNHLPSITLFYRVLAVLLSIYLWACESSSNPSSTTDPNLQDQLITPDDPTAMRDQRIADQGMGDLSTVMNDAEINRPACGTGPSCLQGYQCQCVFETACECVSPMNRRCESDQDCRSEEYCRTVELSSTQTESLCWLEPSKLTWKTCPGDDNCLSSDGVFRVGARSAVITPQGFETARAEGLEGVQMNFTLPISIPSEFWNDCGYDGLCPGDNGYVMADEGELDGELQGVFIAGFREGRPAQYCPTELIGCDRLECCVSQWAHDDLKAQVVVMEQGDIRIAMIALDVIGFFHTDVERLRRRIQKELAFDLIIVASTHNHEGPDLIGRYGPGISVPQRTGVDLRYKEYMGQQITQAVVEAYQDVQPAKMSTAIVDEGIFGMGISDSRPPFIIDDNIPVIRFTDLEDQSIATLISVSNHAEYLWAEQPYLSADYFHFTRRYLREGIVPVAVDEGPPAESRAGLGGVIVAFAGAVGGLMSPDKSEAVDASGHVVESLGYAKADAAGQRIALNILRARDEGLFAPPVQPSPHSLAFTHSHFLTTINNSSFLLAGFVLKVFARDIYNTLYRGGFEFYPASPQVMTEVTALRLGDMIMLTSPGEPFPELLTGGYPHRTDVQNPTIGDETGQRLPLVCNEQGLPADMGTLPCVVSENQRNPPAWDLAPEGPYLYESMGEKPFLIGLGGDFLGYIVPDYDFESGDAPGAHYEETNSTSEKLTGDWLRQSREALDRLSRIQVP